jgi:hypothetical protein
MVKYSRRGKLMGQEGRKLSNRRRTKLRRNGDKKYVSWYLLRIFFDGTTVKILVDMRIERICTREERILDKKPSEYWTESKDCCYSGIVVIAYLTNIVYYCMLDNDQLPPPRPLQPKPPSPLALYPVCEEDRK